MSHPNVCRVYDIGVIEGLHFLSMEYVDGDEIRSGTPTDMSPEQKAGKEVTTRSDLYSLGLVLHEMFTGRRPDDSRSAPASLVKDLDPTIERVILRCLDADPRNRPSSALNVAMALPGGDPIAASGEKEGLEPRTAVACFVGVVLALVAAVLLSHKATLLGRGPTPSTCASSRVSRRGC